MKKILLLLCFGIISSIAGPHNEKVIYIAESPVFRPYEALSKAIAMVESSNNPNAYNGKEKAVGKYQIRPIRLRDYNNKTGKGYELYEMLDTIKSKEVFMFYATKRHYTEIERISREWNGGENGMKKQSTKKYFKKVKKYLDNSKI